MKTENENEQGVTVEQTPTPPASASEIEKLQVVNQALRDEAKKYRQSKAAEKQQKEEALRANGEFKALAQSQESELSEMREQLASFVASDAIYQADNIAREQQLAGSIAGFSEADKALVNSAATITERVALAQRLATPHTQTGVVAPSVAAVASTESTNPISAGDFMSFANATPEDKAEFLAKSAPKKSSFLDRFNPLKK